MSLPKHLQKEPLWDKGLPYREGGVEFGGTVIVEWLEEGLDSTLLRTAQSLVASSQAL